MVDIDDDVDFAAYTGAELEMPRKIVAVLEVASPIDAEDDVPYAFGVQWRPAGFQAGGGFVQRGNFDEPSFYITIGGYRQF